MTKSVTGGPRAASRQRKTLRSRAEICTDTDLVFQARTIEISLVGMSLMSPHELADGALLTVTFQIPTQGRLESVSAAATVLYHTPEGTEGYRMGIRFCDEDSRRTELINTLR